MEENNIESDNTGLVFENIQELSDEETEMIEEINRITENDLDMELQGFKKVNRKWLKYHTKKVNGILKNIATESITGTNNLIKACTILIGRNVGLKPNRQRVNWMKEPWWNRRINESI